MHSRFENLINGNLIDAKTGAARRSATLLEIYAHEVLGWSLARSRAAAQFLKGLGAFQVYCDAK